MRAGVDDALAVGGLALIAWGSWQLWSVAVAAVIVGAVAVGIAVGAAAMTGRKGS